jgi:hypothetical protein
MMRPTIGPAVVRASRIAFLAGVLAIPAVAASPAALAAGHSLRASYRVTGSTFVRKPDFTMALGPGKLAVTVNTATARFRALLSLPDATGSFKQFGIIPVTATTQFVNDGPTSGTINIKTGAVRTTSKITLRIVSLSVSGIGVPVGSSCQTTKPAVVQVKSQPKFSILKGGNLAGSYAIPDFAGCGLATLLINATLPATGNTITLHLGPAKLGK